MIEITADFQSSQNYLMEFLLLDIADLFFQSSYRILCLTVKNHVVEKTGPGCSYLITAVLTFQIEDNFFRFFDNEIQEERKST